MRISAPLFALLFLLLNAGSTRAQEIEQTTAVPARVPGAEERAERTSSRTAMSEAIQNRIRNLAANVINRLTAALSRMDSISTRLDSRIAKMGTTGIDTAPAALKLSEAKDAIVRARLTLAGIGSVHAAVSGETPRESYQAIRVEFVAVQEELKTIQGLLRETVRLLKEPGMTAALPPSREGTTTEASLEDSQ